MVIWDGEILDWKRIQQGESVSTSVIPGRLSLCAQFDISEEKAAKSKWFAYFDFYLIISEDGMEY